MAARPARPKRTTAKPRKKPRKGSMTRSSGVRKLGGKGGVTTIVRG